jgi:hypothetical protein
MYEWHIIPAMTAPEGFLEPWQPYTQPSGRLTREQLSPRHSDVHQVPDGNEQVAQQELRKRAGVRKAIAINTRLQGKSSLCPPHPSGRLTRLSLKSVLDSVREVFIRMQALPPKPYEREGDDPASSCAEEFHSNRAATTACPPKTLHSSWAAPAARGASIWSALRSQEPRAISEAGWRRAFSVPDTRSAASRDLRAS